MKFIKHPPVPGTKKIVIKFLWWPLTINNETRWFETVTIQYEYVAYAKYLNYKQNVIVNSEWKPIKFIE
jgi:hypothetical protein